MTTTDTTGADAGEPFRDWCLAELMGHNRAAGLVTADGPMMTATRLRIDMYRPGDTDPALTQFVAYPGSVYRLTVVTEDTARRLAASMLPAPQPPGRGQLPPGMPGTGYGPHSAAGDDPENDLW